MSERVGNVSFETPQPGEMVFDKPYSEQTAQIIDEEVRKIIDGAFTRTLKLLTDNKSHIEKVRDKFIIFRDSIYLICFLYSIVKIGSSTFVGKRGFE